ncbi:MAG: ABC transporter ATP-binding protein [Chloroflexi bacterium]|nr:ABC transporter ATP-binding protein [Chloroflexota bacterium]
MRALLATPATGRVLDVQRLGVRFEVQDDVVSAVSNVSLTIDAGEIVGVVGESGCGKSTLAMAIMGLLGSTAHITGRVELLGRDLAGLTVEERRQVRGDRMSMIFQDPLTSLDPAFGVGDQVAETIRAHRTVTPAEARARAIGLLESVGIPAAATRYSDPPHRLSGGMRQRVVIATALANDPALLIADEPSTALDVTIQAQLLSLLRDQRDARGMAILLITHDLGVVAQLCDRVAVMYAGQLVETATVEQVFRAPRHPYTQALLAAQPSAGLARGSLRVIGGQVPDLSDPPPGCRFAPRCSLVRPECDAPPALLAAQPGHSVACWADPATHPGVVATAHGTDSPQGAAA